MRKFCRAGFNALVAGARPPVQAVSGVGGGPTPQPRGLAHSDCSYNSVNYYSAQSSGNSFLSQDEKREFMAVFPDLVRDLALDQSSKDLIPLLSKHIENCVEYTVPNGKRNRGYTVPASYKIMLQNKQNITPENLRLANILGWTVEFLQAFFLVADDIMDGSQTRRGQVCWYKQPGIGLTAFNDSILLESFVYSLLRKNFREQPYYLQLLELMLDTTRYTAMGQALDLMAAEAFSSAPVGSPHRMNHFTQERYDAIVKYKTSYYSFHLPVSLAMLMAGVGSEAGLLRQAESILLEMGRFFQVQDDYLDCFGDPAVTGKVGTDIQDGKCSWLVMTALKYASDQQKQELNHRYGTNQESDVEWVKSLYRTLNIPGLYAKFEQEVHEDISRQINQIPTDKLPQEVFTVFLQRIYKRQS